MIVYILAIPVFSFLVPLYAFWHFDDFSWGNTRIVVGESGSKKAVGPDEGTFDPSTVPTKRWDDHERDMIYWEDHPEEAPPYAPYASSVVDDRSSFVSRGNASRCSERSTQQQPTDRAIFNAIERILDSHNLMQLTKKQVRDVLSEQFGTDMEERRDFINKLIEQSLARRL